jgi:hypothetical protein
MFRNMLGFFCEELLAPRPTPKLEDYHMLAVRHCLQLSSTFGGDGDKDSDNVKSILIDSHSLKFNK